MWVLTSQTLPKKHQFLRWCVCGDIRWSGHAIDQYPELIWQHYADLPLARYRPAVDQAIVRACDGPQGCIIVSSYHTYSADHAATCDM
jgi:hypothetical protein